MDELDRTIRRQAIALTIGLWLATAGLFMLPALLSDYPFSASMVAGVGSTTVIGIFISAILFRVAWRLRETPLWRRYGATAMAAVGMAGLTTIMDAYKSQWLMRWLNPELGAENPVFRAIANFVGWVPLFALIAAIYLILIHNAQMAARARELADAREAANRAALAAAAAEGAATSARLEALRYQLNPHFLFNTLNAISSAVITGRADAAEAMLAKLCDFLRATLASAKTGLVAIEDELQTVSDYLEIEAARLGDRLKVEMQCPMALRETPVPAFLLQPLVENAIKHGVGATSRTVTLRIDVASIDAAVRICVRDDAGSACAGGAKGTGLGLANVRARLDAVYGARARLDATPSDDGFAACITLPAKLPAAARHVPAGPAQAG
ncbi:histidine kinase [Sphingomonas oleivorans]|uniref:Histidine kinase n=1 Tax=Sphingomonas oleivorans TaxID=1735121 RepID=A0A2T5FZK9_9SPHN|nr:histidine kinase [Sphingomonas oleivorans]PTQ12144.1 histidine kinase [Sphingomonas oleivorans]